MRTRAITIIVPIILFAAACLVSAADPNMAGEQKQQQSIAEVALPHMLNLLAAAGTLLGVLAAWALRRLTANMQAKQLRDEAIACLEAGVEDAWEHYVRDAKTAAEDGKLTAIERQSARKRALNMAAATARDERVRAWLWAAGEEYIAAIIRKIVQARKAAAVIVLAALLFAGVGCESSSPAAESYFQRMAARVSAMADACDPNDPRHEDPACLTGWRVFSEDLKLYEIMLRGGDPNGAR